MIRPAGHRLTDGMLHLADEATSVEEVLDLLEYRPAFHADAACREHDPDSFFPERGVSPGPAVKICAGCLVLEECRAWALAQGPELAGIWGGLTRRGRLRLLITEDTPVERPQRRRTAAEPVWRRYTLPVPWEHPGDECGVCGAPLEVGDACDECLRAWCLKGRPSNIERWAAARRAGLAKAAKAG